jgi:molybdopterin-guanine dinucleotide biosynthesis protein B
MIPMVCFVGPSGVGKTTLLEKIVGAFKGRGWRVAVIKHAHHGFEIDQPGKDSWRMTQAGCDLVVVSSDRKMALIQEREDEASLEQIVPFIEGKADVILVEGYKNSGSAEIAVFRSAVCRELPAKSDRLLAIVADQKLPLEVLQFDFTEVDSIVDFIAGHVPIVKTGREQHSQPTWSTVS